MNLLKKIIPQWIKNIYHLKVAILANLVFGFPSRKIKIIGVTGTNGKTTTVQMIAKILEESGRKVAVASTINFKIGSKEWVNKSKFTTLSGFKLQKFIKKAVKNGCDFLVLEVSSHSLDQNRAWGVDFDTAVITNITREHLDYHKTMETYREAKMKLFRKAKTVVVNLDMEKPEDFLSFNDEKKYGYSTGSQNNNLKIEIIRAGNIELGINYTKYQIQDTKYTLNIPGMFNVENALAATCVGLNYGVSLEEISKALEKIKNIPGRLESVPNNKEIKIIIDYAVTPDSLEKLYELINEIKNKTVIPAEARIQKSKLDSGLPRRQTGSMAGMTSERRLERKPSVIAVFGACGDRDRGKRPIMGEIVSRYADFAIVTNEDPYDEDPKQIIDEVFSGAKKNLKEGESAWRILDRREAIHKALQMAKKGDIVVVTGKGAEEIMQVGKKQIPWSDKRVILEELKKL